MVRSRKSDEVLESARRLFLERGYDGTTMEDVAAEASVSKATIYSNFAHKDALLRALLERVGDEAAAILAAATAPLEGPGPLEDRLTAVATALVEGVLRPEVVQLRRLAVAEAGRSPELGRAYWERGPGATLRLLAAAFQRLADSGELAVADPEGAADRFAYALLGPLQDRALLAPDLAPTAAQRAAHVRSVVRRVLRDP